VLSHNTPLRPLTKPNPQVRDGSTINVSLPSRRKRLRKSTSKPFRDAVFFFIYFEALTINLSQLVTQVQAILCFEIWKCIRSKAPSRNGRFSLEYMWKEFGMSLAHRRGFESESTDYRVLQQPTILTIETGSHSPYISIDTRLFHNPWCIFWTPQPRAITS
jgi:hypothetical protein